MGNSALTWLKVGFIAILQFIAACAGTLFGGWFSDFVLKRGSVSDRGKEGTGDRRAATRLRDRRRELRRIDALVIAILCVAYFAHVRRWHG